MYYYIGKINRENHRSTEKIRHDFCKKENTQKIPLKKNKGEISICSDERLDKQYKIITKNDKIDGLKVIFEGFLYNLNTLQKRYFPGKHNLIKTNADLIAWFYSMSGIKLFTKLDGNYSFVIIDEKRNINILHRSESGLKPLYYHITNRALLFSSYLKALIKQKEIKPEINPTKIYSFFMTDGLSLGDDTEYKNIYNLLPGELLIIKNKQVKTRILNTENDYQNLIGKNEDQVIDEFYQKTEDTFRTLYKTLKKIGIAFSGGLDTHTILAFAHKFGIPAKTFTIKFLETQNTRKDKDYLEAKNHAQKYNAQHKEIKLGPKKFISELKDVLGSLEKITSLAEINSFMIKKIISPYSDIILSGDGSEELLGMMNLQRYGYNADQLIQTLPWHNAKDLSDSIMENYYNMLFWRGWGWHYERRTEKDLREAIFSKDCCETMSKVNLRKIFYQCLQNCPDTSALLEKKSPVPSIFNKILWMDYRNFILHNKITVCDISSRLYSFFSVFPYLDKKFVNIAGQIPGSMKFKPGVRSNGTKIILRQAMSRLIGEKSAFPGWKSGSDFPINEWLHKKESEKYIKEILSTDRIKENKIIDHEYVNTILKEHYKSKQIDHTPKIGKLIIFQLWWENNIKN